MREFELSGKRKRRIKKRFMDALRKDMQVNGVTREDKKTGRDENR